jgi:hypothetical protein
MTNQFSAPALAVTWAGGFHPLQPLAAFCQTHGLPDGFGVMFFEPEGALGYHPVWQKTALLQEVAQVLHTAVPRHIPLAQLTELPSTLAYIFQNELVTRGADMALLRDDVEQVATDLQNILEPAAYKLVELFYQHGEVNTAVVPYFDMTAIYQELFDSTIFLGTRTHGYPHNRQTWLIHLIHSLAYGPIGLQVETESETYYLEDRTLAFPALDFLASTGISLGQALCDGFSASSK